MSGAANEAWLAELGVIRQAIAAACADPATRPLGYRLANNIFSSLYTAMRAREAVEILESVLASGDGPADIGSQVARRAGICASEVRGTYEGLALLDRAERFAVLGPDADRQKARNASIRAEMHLDAGALDAARAEVERGLALGADDPYVVRQLRRTLVDIHVWRASSTRPSRSPTSSCRMRRRTSSGWRCPPGSSWRSSPRSRAGRWRPRPSPGRPASTRSSSPRTASPCSPTRSTARWPPPPVRASSTTSRSRGACGSGSAQEARDRRGGECHRAAGLAADIIVLADSIRLGRDGVEAAPARRRARRVRRDGAGGLGVPRGAAPGHEARLPLRAADALEGLDRALVAEGSHAAGRCTAAARALRTSRRAVARQRAGLPPAKGAPHRGCPADWVVDGQFTGSGLEAVTALFSEQGTAPRTAHPLRCSPAPSARWRPRRPGPDQPADRRAALRLPAHGRRAPRAHLPQARHQLPGARSRR